MNSFLFFLAAPSAMFEGIEIAALLICDVKPYNSSFGNCFVLSYMLVTYSMDFFQTSKSLCVLTKPYFQITNHKSLITDYCLLITLSQKTYPDLPHQNVH